MRIVRPARGALPADAGGAAYVEFVLAFMPIFVLFMGLLQIMVLYSARIMTQHAATRAARTASVVADDDPAFYRGEPRGFLGGPRASAAQLAQSYRRHVGLGAGPTLTSRRGAIELSAMLALLAITPRDPSGSGDVSGDGVGQRARHTRERVDVEVLHGGDGTPATEVRDEDLRVRVTYRYPCAIPFAGPLVCGGAFNEMVAEATSHNHVAPYPYLAGAP